MGQLPADYADRVSQVFGDRLGDVVRSQANDARSFVNDRARTFSVNGSATPLDPSPDDPVVDLGGTNRNEVILALPLERAEGTPVAGVVADAVGFVPSTGSNASFFVHRTLDPGVSTSKQLGAAEFSGVIFSAVSPTADRVRVVVVDAWGARVLFENPTFGDAGVLRQYFQASTPTRVERFDADVDHVYRQTRGVIRRVPIREENDVATAYPITDGFAYASRTARLSLEPATETVGPADERDDAADQTRLGRSDYAVVRSGLSSNDGGGPGSGSGASPSAAPVDPPISISGSYGPVTDAAPPGFVWGDPGSLSLCSRASQDGCLSCCQTITGRYGAAALGALSAGAVSSAGAAAGIVTIPVAWAPVAIGAVVGGLILIGGFIHGTLCEKGCRTLYDRTTGDSIRTRQFQLTSAELSSSSGEQIAYRGQMTFANGNAVDVRMTREQLMAVVWGGGTVAVESSSAPTSYVSLARRPGGTGLYLRSSRDGRLVNNLRELPEFVP